MIKLELVFFLGLLLGAIGWHFLYKFIKHRIELQHQRRLQTVQKLTEEIVLKSTPMSTLLEEISERPTGEFFQQEHDYQSRVSTIPPKSKRKKTQ